MYTYKSMQLLVCKLCERHFPSDASEQNRLVGRRKAFFRNDKAETGALPKWIASFGESTRFGQRVTKSVWFESVDEVELMVGQTETDWLVPVF